MASYDSLAKNMHRAAVVEMHLLRPERPILYLDDETAGATRYFMSREVPPERLVPVNFCPRAVQEIRSLTGVDGVVRDVDALVQETPCDAYSVVWLDYVRRTCTTEVMVAALRAAPHVCITLSTRALKASDIEDLTSRAKRVASVLERPHPYKGRGNVSNMVRFSLARRSTAEGVDTDVAAETCGDVAVQEEREPTDETGGAASWSVGDKVFVEWRRKSWLTAVVVEVGCDGGRGDAIRVRFDCDGKILKVSPRMTRENKTRTCMKRHLGALVGIPLALWDARGRKGLADTRKVGKRAVFKIGRMFYGKNERLTLNAVFKDGTICKRDEPFLITPEQALCWMMQAPRATADARRDGVRSGYPSPRTRARARCS